MIAPAPQTALTSRAMQSWATGVLPTPHLLDATWWFDDFTINFFHREMEKREEQVVVCLGTPTLLLGTNFCGTNRRLILIDKDRVLTESLQSLGYIDVFTRDLTLEPAPCFSADMVIADPPWYESETRSFLAAAQNVSRRGAEILISLPPVGIRPGIEAERERLFAWCRQRGMNLVALTKDATRYVCPPFEQNVLRSAGSISTTQGRVGDLARIRVEVGNAARILPANKPLKWEDICLGSTRFRLTVKPPVEPGDIRLVPMGWSDDIFPSCSRRYPGRETVDVWTSGNRAFRCNDTRGLSALLRGLRTTNWRHLADLGGMRTKVPYTYERQTKEQVLKVIEIEEMEYAAIRRQYV